MTSYGSVQHEQGPQVGPGGRPNETDGETTSATAAETTLPDTSSSELESQPLLRQPVLSPDDPQVSVLQLAKIRVLRSAIKLMVAVNAVLTVVFVLSDFVAIPGLNNRGRSFLELDLAALCAVTNVITLWSFTVPAYAERLVGYVSAGLVVVDVLVVAAVTYLRHQFGGLGGGLLAWTFLNIVLNCYADYWIEQAKRAQEIRYTGRPETRRSVYELAVVAVKFVAKLAVFLVLWNISLSLWLAAFDTHEKPWGAMVGVNNDQFKVHVACFGDVANGTQPIVLVEGGQRTSSEDFSEWIDQMFSLNQVERYCVWDRPGYGFSDSAPSPVSISIIVDYLIEALQKQDIQGPFTPVGFDIGGLYARVFAARKLESVASIVLVDSWHEDLLRLRPFAGRVDEADALSELELMTTWQGLKLWLRGVAAPLGLVSNLHWFLHPKRHSSRDRIYGADMYYSPQYVRARIQEQVSAAILSYNEVAGADISAVPAYVVSSDQMIQRSKNWGAWQRQISKWGSTQEWAIAKAPHHVWKSDRVHLQQLLGRAVATTLSQRSEKSFAKTGDQKLP